MSELEETRLEWYDCPECGMAYTWFRVEVMAGLELYGWLHMVDVRCWRDKGMQLGDVREGNGSDTKGETGGK